MSQHSIKSHLRQLDYLIQQSKAAINAGIPIIYFVSDDVSLIDRLLRTEKIVPFWYFNTDDEWTRKNDPDFPLLPANIYVCDGDIASDFGQWGKGKGDSYGLQTQPISKSSFLSSGYNFKYVNSNGVRGGIPQVIGVRNYHRSHMQNSPGDAILQRLVTYRSNFNADDGIQRCTILLQSPIFEVPDGLQPYVEVINVPPLHDEEIAQIIVDFAARIGEQPYKSCLDQLTASMRGLGESRIQQLLHRICLQCGGIFNAATEHEGVEIVSDAKQQMLKKEGLLKAIDLGDKEAAGLEEVKKWVVQRQPILADPIEAKKRWIIDAPKGILVNGIPGTGKSLLAKEIASRLSLPLYQFDMGSVLGKYMGESEHNLSRMFQLAESLSPCVLWIDEIEKAFSSATSSNDGDSGVGKRVFGNFLTWMQEKTCPCFIFATSNNISKIPPEFLRRGRFDMKFYTFMPTKAECRAIFKGVMAGKGDKYRKKFDPEIFADKYLDEILEYCGKKGKFMTGADIDGIVQDAKFYYYLAHRDANITSDAVIYKAQDFKKSLMKAIDQVRTYGETDMHRIVDTLYLLAENLFAPASTTNIIDIRDVDYHKHTLSAYSGAYNGYDDLLYEAICRESEMKYPKKQAK